MKKAQPSLARNKGMSPGCPFVLHANLFYLFERFSFRYGPTDGLGRLLEHSVGRS